MNLMSAPEARRALKLPISAETPLLWNRDGYQNYYTGSGLRIGIERLLRAAGIRSSSGRIPRVHDFRHTFAVHALLRWYRTGENVQIKLPFLSAYMGHASVVSTQYYAHFIDALAACASERFEKHCVNLLSREGVR
jgi:integrase/recombinase XerD